MLEGVIVELIPADLISFAILLQKYDLTHHLVAAASFGPGNSDSG